MFLNLYTNIVELCELHSRRNAVCGDGNNCVLTTEFVGSRRVASPCLASLRVFVRDFHLFSYQ